MSQCVEITARCFEVQILFLAHRIPYPPNKGDKIRSYNQVKYLAARHAVDLVCLADDPQDMQHKPLLQALCRTVEVIPLSPPRAKLKGLWRLVAGGSISQGYFHHREMQRVVDDRLKNFQYDVVICFSSPMAEYLFRSGQLNTDGRTSMQNSTAAKRPRLIMDYCDVDSDKWSQYARTAPFPLSLLYGQEGRRLLAFDARVNRAMDSSVFVSRKEAELFQTLLPDTTNVHVVHNGVDHTYFHPDFARRLEKANPTTHRLLFTGAMDYRANVDGMLWFYREVLPIIRSTYPHIGLTIVGSNPDGEIRALASQRITITGFVQDIRPSYQTADLSIAPLRMARGVQNKVIEAMAMGKPVVSTSAGVQGIQPLTNDPLLVADSAQDFASAVCRILDNPDLALELGTKGRQFVVGRFDWERNMAQLEALLNPATSARIQHPAGL